MPFLHFSYFIAFYIFLSYRKSLFYKICTGIMKLTLKQCTWFYKISINTMKTTPKQWT